MIEQYYTRLFNSYASTLAKSSGIKSIQNMFASLSSDMVITNNDHSYEQNMVSNLDAITLRDGNDVIEGTFNAYLKNAINETIRNNLTNTVL